VGAAGVVGTTVLAIKATPKALALLEEAREEKGEDLTKLEVVKVAGPVYIPTIMTGVTSLACIFGANVLGKRQQAALMSAYALLDNSYKEYKEKIGELYGGEAHARVREEIAKDKYEAKDETLKVEDGKELFYDYYSGRYFEATPETVQKAEYQVNRNLVAKGYAYLNDFYEALGVELLEDGWDTGWTPSVNLDHGWQEWLDFTHEKTVMDDGLECTIISMDIEPVFDFAYY
jgi:hypothetical protein